MILSFSHNNLKFFKHSSNFSNLKHLSANFVLNNKFAFDMIKE